MNLAKETCIREYTKKNQMTESTVAMAMNSSRGIFMQAYRAKCVEEFRKRNLSSRIGTKLEDRILSMDKEYQAQKKEIDEIAEAHAQKAVLASEGK